MNLEEAIAVTLAFPSGVVVKPRPSKEDQEVIDWARQFVRANALDAIAAARKAWGVEAAEKGGAAPDPVANAITEMYGGRCADFDAGCCTCSAWKLYDEMAKASAALDQDLPCEVTVDPATRFAKGVKVETVLAALDLRRKEGAHYDKAVARLNRLTDAQIRQTAVENLADKMREADTASASNLNENNISTPAPEPFQGKQTRADGLIEAAEVLESLAKNYRGLGMKPLADTLTGIAVTFRERSGIGQ